MKKKKKSLSELHYFFMAFLVIMARIDKHSLYRKARFETKTKQRLKQAFFLLKFY
jgi:hypothetical protein